MEVETRYIGNPFRGYSGAGRLESIDWTFGSKPYERELRVSLRAGPTLLGTFFLFTGILVDVSSETDSDDNTGYRWEGIGTIENTMLTLDPTIALGWASFTFTIPAFAKGVRLSSDMTWVAGDEPRGLTMTLYPVIRRSV